MSSKVRDPRGGGWTIRRRWLEHRSRLRGWSLMRTSNFLAGVIFLPLLAGWIATVFFEFLGETSGRFLRGRPWLIEARLDAAMRPEILSWRVRGWSASRRALAEAAEALARGEEVTSFGEPERSIAAPDGPAPRYLPY
jgi:hypothetical protein